MTDYFPINITPETFNALSEDAQVALLSVPGIVPALFADKQIGVVTSRILAMSPAAAYGILKVPGTFGLVLEKAFKKEPYVKLMEGMTASQQADLLMQPDVTYKLALSYEDEAVMRMLRRQNPAERVKLLAVPLAVAGLAGHGFTKTTNGKVILGWLEEMPAIDVTQVLSSPHAVAALADIDAPRVIELIKELDTKQRVSVLAAHNAIYGLTQNSDNDEAVLDLLLSLPRADAARAVKAEHATIYLGRRHERIVDILQRPELDLLTGRPTVVSSAALGVARLDS